MNIRFAHRAHIFNAVNAAFCDQQRVLRHGWGQCQRGLKRCLKSAQVAVVDAKQSRIKRKGSIQFFPVVHLNQNIHRKIRCRRRELCHLRLLKSGHNQQDAVGTDGP